MTGRKTCKNCGTELELIVSSITNHSGSKYTGGNGSFAVHIKLACDCNVETAQSTDLTTIDFNGDPPEGWQ